MQQIDLITGLPSRLSCIILQDWLNLKSVVALDSAYCCHAHREEFLGLLQSDEYFVKEQIVISQNSAVSSLLKRFNEKIRSVKFKDSITPFQEDLVKKHCNNLTRVEFRNEKRCTPELWAILKTNPHIEHLTIMRDYEYDNSRPFCRSFESIVLPKLTTLTVNCYYVGNENILEVMKMKNIVRLDLSLCDIAGPVFLQIAHLCPRLRILKLAKVFELTDAIIDEITAACPHIEHLDISYISGITDDGILSVVQNLKGLKTLIIQTIATLTDKSLSYIGNCCAATLHTLVISCLCAFPFPGYALFSPAAVNELLERCAQLRTLYIYVGDDLDSSAIPFVFSPAAIHNLTYLVLLEQAASDENLVTIGAYEINLQVLILEGDDYTYHAFAAIVNGCPSLKELYYQSPCSPVFGMKRANASKPFPPSYWMSIRPGLKVNYLQSGWDSQRDVMNM